MTGKNQVGGRQGQDISSGKSCRTSGERRGFETPTGTDSCSKTEDVFARVHLGIFPEEAIRVEGEREGKR